MSSMTCPWCKDVFEGTRCPFCTICWTRVNGDWIPTNEDGTPWVRCKRCGEWNPEPECETCKSKEKVDVAEQCHALWENSILPD